MIGTTRSRVSYFMNRFRQRGFIEYNGRIPGPQVAAECDSVGPVPGQNSVSAPFVETGPGQSEPAPDPP